MWVTLFHSKYFLIYLFHDGILQIRAQTEASEQRYELLKLVCKPLKAFLVNISDKFSFSTKNSDV